MKQKTKKDVDLTGVALVFIIGVAISFFVTVMVYSAKPEESVLATGTFFVTLSGLMAVLFVLADLLKHLLKSS
jgi:membrane protein YdbS with pleckstrin-like domain